MMDGATQTVAADVDIHGHCSHCGGTHYGTGPRCVERPEEQARYQQAVSQAAASGPIGRLGMAFEKMQRYIGTKIVLAEPATEGSVKALPVGQEDRPGYKVVYEDGYTSWSPKETFERAYRRVTDAELNLLQGG